MSENEPQDDLLIARELLDTLNRLKAAGYWDDDLLQQARVLDARLGRVYRQMRYGDGPRQIVGLAPHQWWPWWRDQVLNVVAAMEAGTVTTDQRGGEEMSGEYDVGQVCLNGHAISGSTQHLPQFSKKHCDKCGAETITKCPVCDEPIRGDYWGGAIFLQTATLVSGEIVFGTPKTDAGRRTRSIDPATVSVLRTHTDSRQRSGWRGDRTTGTGT